MTPVVSARGLRKIATDGRRRITVLDGLDLTLPAGRVVGVVGPSLAGKTTLVSLLAGWEPADGGEITWAGRPPGARSPVGWSHVAVVPQGFGLLDELTVEENIRLAARVATGRRARRDDDARLGEVCRALGIAHLRDRSVTEISVGERQRTTVARALVDRPAVLLADEPIAHQDERNGRTVLALLRAAADEGAAVLVASRTPDVVAGIADEVVALGAGR